MATKQRGIQSKASPDKRDSIKEPLQFRLTSPRCLKEEKCYYSAANSPSLAVVPNDMAATVSARAKARSLVHVDTKASEPRVGSRWFIIYKMRLAYQANDTGAGLGHNLRRPTLKCAPEGHFGMEKESICSPCSTTDLKWLK
ncbi:hypothetical protein V6N13_086281 [Hibiscus sabdariffa]|uniref:DUF4005 domain-containing protein n=1 Tax=Hibiscus sabdariffa TaxID=183260 RepID=A0ABR2FSX1_9ROSI